jgi:hypothetical protein
MEMNKRRLFGDAANALIATKTALHPDMYAETPKGVLLLDVAEILSNSVAVMRAIGVPVSYQDQILKIRSTIEEVATQPFDKIPVLHISDAALFCSQVARQ